MIPKTIHYCWFGGKPKPALVEKCIASWKEYAPDYELVEWNESNYDVDRFSYSKEAWENQKYAFVSDVARFEILYEQGGIYLDTDVELLKPLEALLENEFFLGYDQQNNVNPGLIMGSTAGNEWLKKILDQYRKIHFLLPSGRPDLTTVVTRTSELLMENGIELNGHLFHDDQITLYPSFYFDPLSFETGLLSVTDETFSIHHYAASWKTDTDWVLYRIGKVIKRILGERVYRTLASLKHRLYG